MDRACRCAPRASILRTGGALLALVAAAFAGAADSPAPKVPRQLEQVVVVFKTHFDLGYTDLAANVVQRYRTSMIDQALEVVDRNRGLPPDQQFVWTLSGWPLHAILDWPAQTPERRSRVAAAFREGRFVTHALPATVHTELLELEDLVRGLGHASRLTRAAGLPLPRDAKMSDVPSHAWILPSLLRHAGVEFLHLGCNPASSSPRVPALFWWESPDGSRLLTFYSADGYGSSLGPPADWPHKTWLALIQTGDNHGPPPPDEVKALLAQAAEQMPGVKVRIGRLSDFADAIRAEAPELPVRRVDMPDTWIHGPMSDPAGVALARNLRPAMAATEALGTLMRSWGLAAPDRSAALADARENSLLYGEHTWGGALSWITPYGDAIHFKYGEEWKAERASGRFAKIEASWAEHSAYIEKARDLIQPALDEDLRALAAATAPAGRRIVVFNPLPWSRDGVVTVSPADPSIKALRAADGGEVLPVEIAGDALRFVARGVPAMGYRTFVPAPSPGAGAALTGNEQARTIENAFLRVTLNPARGTIASIVDLRTGREYRAAAGTPELGQYLYERFDADQTAAYLRSYGKLDVAWFTAEFGKPRLPPASVAPHRIVSPSDFTLRLEQSAVAVSAVMTAAAGSGVPHAVTTRVTLYRDQPWLEVATTLHDKPADPWPEAGWLCLSFGADQPRFRLGRQASIVDPARDIVAGTNRHMQAVTTGLSLTGADGNGLDFCPVDHPLVSLGEPGGWKYSLDYVPRVSAAYLNLFNNQWTTNFRFWNSGTWASRVRIWPSAPATADAGLVTPSLEARSPLLAVSASGPAGGLPAAQRGLELSRRDVEATAFGPNPDGPGTVLRLWEIGGRSGTCRVTLPRGLGVRTVQFVDLRGEPLGEPRPITGDSLEVEVRAFAPVSLVLR